MTNEEQAWSYLRECVAWWRGEGDPDDDQPQPPEGVDAYPASEIRRIARPMATVLRQVGNQGAGD